MEDVAAVVLFPEASVARERISRALAEGGLELRPGLSLEGAAAALVDLSAEGGAEMLRRLRQGAGGDALPVVALLPTGPSAGRVGALPADAHLSLERVEAELVLRVAEARARRAAERRSAEGQRNLAFLLELTARYAETADVDALLHDVTRELAEALDIVRASLIVVDGDSRS